MKEIKDALKVSSFNIIFLGSYDYNQNGSFIYFNSELQETRLKSVFMRKYIKFIKCLTYHK